MDAKIVGNVTPWEANGTRTPQRRESASPWYRRPGILLAAAASVAGVGIVVSGPGEPGTAPRRYRDEHPVGDELLAHRH